MEKKDRINNIMKDTALLKESMEIVNQLVLEQEEKINFIEDEINQTLSEVKNGKEDIAIADEYKEYQYSYILYFGGLIGAGLVYLFI